MDIEAIRKFCLSFPHTTENVQWGIDLCFKVDGKLFVVTPLEVAPAAISFKCSPENFVELCERPGIRPAAYMARAQWVSLERLDMVPDSELRELIGESYRLVWERLPKRRQAELEMGRTSRKQAAKSVKARTTKSKAPARKPAKKKGAKASGRG
jgi:predicted DNA-binding protein (MmcQ/YjbR family)